MTTSALRLAGTKIRRPARLPGGPTAYRAWRKNHVSCTEATDRLQQVLDEGRPAPVALVAHVETCLSCQGELARYRKLMRLLHQLRGAEVIVPGGIVADVLAAVEEAANRRAVRSLLTGRRLAYGAAVASAGTAGVGLAVLAWSRTRAAAPGASLASGAGRRRRSDRRLAG